MVSGRKPPELAHTIPDIPLDNVVVPPAPDYLSPEAADIWPMIVREMVARNIFDTDCRELVAMYCTQFARWLAAEKCIEEQGTVILATRYVGAGQHRKEITERAPNPMITVSDRASDRMGRIAAELGLTPISRRRVSKVQRNVSTAPAARWLKPVPRAS